MVGRNCVQYLDYRPGRLRLTGVTDLGRPVLDQVTARGAQVGDRLCVYEPGAARLGCKEMRSDRDRLDLVAVDRTQWSPDLRVAPVTSRTIDLSVSGVPAGLTVRAQLFPTFAASDTRPLELVLTPTAEGYAGRFELATPTPEGLIRVWVDGAAAGQPARGRSAGVD